MGEGQQAACQRCSFPIGVLLIGGKLIGEKENELLTLRPDSSYNWVAGECFRKVKSLTPLQAKRSVSPHAQDKEPEVE